MKVFIVYHIPDYIGIDIDGIYLDEADAKAACDKLNAEDWYFQKYHQQTYDYDDYEVVEHAK